MKTIGLLGGMSWESTVSYYQIINETVREQLGGLRSAQCLLYSVDFGPIEQDQKTGRWDRVAETVCGAAQHLARGGADFLVICSNTIHKVAPAIVAHSSIPLLHIAEVTAQALQNEGRQCVALLGTSYTMEQDFYRGIVQRYGIETIIPDDAARKELDRIIFQELCQGTVTARSKKWLGQLVESLAFRGAQGTILGCTELGLLLGAEDVNVPIYDTTYIHARQAALLAIEKE